MDKCPCGNTAIGSANGFFYCKNYKCIDSAMAAAFKPIQRMAEAVKGLRE